MTDVTAVSPRSARYNQYNTRRLIRDCQALEKSSDMLFDDGDGYEIIINIKSILSSIVVVPFICVRRHRGNGMGGSRGEVGGWERGGGRRGL